MSLLTQLTERSLDEGYAAAAARRDPAARPQTGLVLAIGLLAVGLLLATAAAQARSRASAVAATRSVLIDKITERTEEADRRAADVARLRASVAKARQDRLQFSVAGSRLARQLTRLEAVTGAAPVAGPGLVVRLDDAPAAEPAQAEADPRAQDPIDNGRVTDRDLQTIVNELWVAGAEAIAVNGQRLTTLSAIRSAGPNILVAFRPLAPPYDVVAVGDAAAMRSKVVDGFAGSYLKVLGNYGISSFVKTRDSVQVPASSGLTVRYAVPMNAGGGP